MTQANPTSAPAASGTQQDSVKETIISVIISFAMAFVFRSYVVEPFRIPTGSMAPTLLGAHMRFQSPAGGYDWTVNPRDYNGNTPLGIQGSTRNGYDPITLQDPMTGFVLSEEEQPLRAGDRILVLKYIYLLREPKRYEVVVFKNPEDPNVNLIKRLIGLPGEDVLIVDGDIFVRASGTDAAYAITRKPDRVQQEVWAPLFVTDFAPLDGDIPGWRPPWVGEGWELGTHDYRWNSAETGTLEWNADLRAIDDATPYNASLSAAHPARAVTFPVSDLRVRARVRPDSDGLVAQFNIHARGQRFQATINTDGATITAFDTENSAEVFSASTAGSFLTPGAYADVEFWHADQKLSLWVNGKDILEETYGWAPAERYARSAAEGLDRLEPADPATIQAPSVSMSFSGSPVSLSGVGLDRDLYYRAVRQSGRYFRATHPTYPATLGADQYFMLGDNSAASHDGRSWNQVNSWIGSQYGYDRGVVPRGLILGKAFMVYWPAPFKAKAPPGITLPVPDVGRVHFIR